MRIDHPSDSFGRPGQLVKISVVFFEKMTYFQLRDTVSIRHKHEKECGWFLCFFIFYFFIFFAKGMIVDNKTNSDQGNGFDRYAGRV